MGIFVSLGTGKRPGGTNNQQHEWWEGFVGGSVGDFAEARRRLISKIEACEDIHQQMLNQYLPQRGIPKENYCRLNVEVGVGEFGMNEWSRVADISTNTRRYLAKPEVQKIVYDAAVKIAKIERGKRRMENHVSNRTSFVDERLDLPQPSHPMIAELPAEETLLHTPQSPKYSPVAPPMAPLNPTSQPYQHQISDQEKIPVGPTEHLSPAQANAPRLSDELVYRPGAQISPAGNSPNSSIYGSGSDYGRTEAPPLPPKTPISPGNGSHLYAKPRLNGHVKPPYPDSDGPPPVVNKLRKPEYSAH